MNSDFFNLNNSLQASNEFLDSAYPKCKEAADYAANKKMAVKKIPQQKFKELQPANLSDLAVI